ncbi:MAG TPA: 16S rRNA (guanine(966)-N(2))-methyltransferase RsmD [Bacteroidales bacterium]|nr:16S rRNA (guanine(966)-N(2))-methyltransferase RsmD [Bacteroidales bacterium]
MRIISGKYKGRRIAPPTNISARPTTDFAKESLFNLIENRVGLDGIDVLDLFAGTGGIGLEFVSRGANQVISVEKAHMQQNFIIRTCRSLGIDNLTLVRGDVFQYIKSCQQQFDFIFADPPYQLTELPTLPDLILQNDMLADGGWFVLEHSEKNDFSHHPHFVEHRQYGSVNFSFFR